VTLAIHGELVNLAENETSGNAGLASPDSSAWLDEAKRLHARIEVPMEGKAVSEEWVWTRLGVLGRKGSGKANWPRCELY